MSAHWRQYLTILPFWSWGVWLVRRKAVEGPGVWSTGGWTLTLHVGKLAWLVERRVVPKTLERTIETILADLREKLDLEEP